METKSVQGPIIPIPVETRSERGVSPIVELWIDGGECPTVPRQIRVYVTSSEALIMESSESESDVLSSQSTGLSFSWGPLIFLLSIA